MPNCFQLLSKETGELMDLKKVDEEICEYLGVPVHPKYWVEYWYNSIGRLIATKIECSLGSMELREKTVECSTDLEEQMILIRILDFLESKYTSKSWYQTK